MSTEFLEYYVNESAFGASTSLAVKIENEKVTESLDTSTYETNYVWDGGFSDGLFVGKTKSDMQEVLNGWFDDFEDEFRSPHIAKRTMTQKEWQSIKLKRTKEKLSMQKIEQGAENRHEGYLEHSQNKDVHAEKLKKKVKKASNLPLKAYKDFLQDDR